MKDINQLKPIFLFFFIFLIFNFLININCVEANNTINNVILQDKSFSLVNSNTFYFNQGYNLTVKSVNVETQRVWLELSLNNKILISDIFKPGDILIYNKNGKKIFEIYLNKIYSGEIQGKELVHFKPVYQYLDTDISKPVNNDNRSNISVDTPLNPEGTNNSFSNLNIYIICLIIFIFLLILFLKRK